MQWIWHLEEKALDTFTPEDLIQEGLGLDYDTVTASKLEDFLQDFFPDVPQ